MTELVVIVPSRGRPDAAAELAHAFDMTCTAPTRLLFALDESDLNAEAYQKVKRLGYSLCLDIDVEVYTSTSMVEALNLAAVKAARWSPTPPFAIGFMGDDHRPRSRGWDAAYLNELHRLGTGMVYGDDELQGQNLPTQIAMTTDIVDTLGYMAPPALTHLFVDNYWRDLGRRARCIQYLKDVTVEHVHPVSGKAAWTPGHRRVNTHEMYETDRTMYNGFVAMGRLEEDVAKVVKLRGGGG